MWSQLDIQSLSPLFKLQRCVYSCVFMYIRELCHSNKSFRHQADTLPMNANCRITPLSILLHCNATLRRHRVLDTRELRTTDSAR